MEITKEILNIRKENVATALHHAGQNHILTTADEIYDESFEARQSEINEGFNSDITTLREDVDAITGVSDLTSYRIFTLFKKHNSDCFVN